MDADDSVGEAARPQEDEALVEHCGYCGELLVPRANFCHRCGAQVLREKSPILKPPPPAAPQREPAASSGSDGKLLWQGQPSYAVIFVKLLALVPAIGALSVAAYALDPHVPVPLKRYAVALSAALALLRVLGPWYRCATERYRLTSRALWVRSGLVHQVDDRYALREFLSLSLDRTLLERMFRLGSVELHFVRAGQAPLILHHLSRPGEVVELLDRAIAAAGERSERTLESQHAAG